MELSEQHCSPPRPTHISIEDNDGSVIRNYINNILNAKTLEFWIEVKKYKQLYEIVQKLGVEIYSKFIDSQSLNRIDISDNLRLYIKNRAVKTSSISIWQDTFDEAAHYTAQLLEQEITTNTAPNSPVSPKDRRSRSLRNSVNMQSVLVRSRLDGAPEFIFTEQPKKNKKKGIYLRFFQMVMNQKNPLNKRKWKK